jgi:hypothetical protein
MTTLSSPPPAVSPLVLQTVGAMIVVAVLVTLALVVAYSVVAAGAAWVLLLIVGTLRLLLMAVDRTWAGLRAHLGARRIRPETVPDLRVRPSG